MISDSAVTADKLHVPALALSGVIKDTVLSPPVAVAVLTTAIACEEEYVWDAIRRADPAALLASVDLVDIPLPVICPANLEWDAIGGDLRGADYDEAKASHGLGNCAIAA